MIWKYFTPYPFNEKLNHNQMDMQIELHILVKADVYNYSARVFLIGCLCLKISMSIDYLIDITTSYPVLAQ